MHLAWAARNKLFLLNLLLSALLLLPFLFSENDSFLSGFHCVGVEYAINYLSQHECELRIFVTNTNIFVIRADPYLLCYLVEICDCLIESC